tara:strand:+ start:42 stop:293 length:252 start_codon:yes stop_codon:yes gene_type:complete
MITTDKAKMRKMIRKANTVYMYAITGVPYAEGMYIAVRKNMLLNIIKAMGNESIYPNMSTAQFDLDNWSTELDDDGLTHLFIN